MQNNKDKEKNRSFPSNNPFRLYSFYLIDYLKDTQIRRIFCRLNHYRIDAMREVDINTLSSSALKIKNFPRTVFPNTKGFSVTIISEYIILKVKT